MRATETNDFAQKLLEMLQENDSESAMKDLSEQIDGFRTDLFDRINNVKNDLSDRIDDLKGKL